MRVRTVRTLSRNHAKPMIPSVKLGNGAVFVLCTTAVGQSLAITAVRNSFSDDDRLSPGVIADVYYKVPPGTAFEDVFVMIGGYRAQGAGYHGPADPRGPALSVIVPRELPAGSTNVVLATARTSSPPLRVQLVTYAPGVKNQGTWCKDDVRLFNIGAVGFGASMPPTASNSPWIPGQDYAIAAHFQVTIAGVPAEVVSSQAYPWLGGYGFSVRASEDTPEGIQRSW